MGERNVKMELPIEMLECQLMIHGPDSSAGRILSVGDQFKKPVYFILGNEIIVRERDD